MEADGLFFSFSRYYTVLRLLSVRGVIPLLSEPVLAGLCLSVSVS